MEYPNHVLYLFLVKVGYEYEMCPSIVWDTQLTTMEGHNPVLTQAIGGWTFSIHHTFHADKGIVQLGNSGLMKLSEQPPMMSTVMGDGTQRHLLCDKCTGKLVHETQEWPKLFCDDMIIQLCLVFHMTLTSLPSDHYF